jgi:hypothetical protein
MLLLPPIKENKELKPPLVRRHSIADSNTDYFKSGANLELDRQFTLISESNISQKSALKTRFKEFDVKASYKTYEDVTPKLRVNFSSMEKTSKLPSLDSRSNLNSSLEINKQLQKRSTPVTTLVKKNSSLSSASLSTTLAARASKSTTPYTPFTPNTHGKQTPSLSSKLSSKEYQAKKNYLYKNEKSRRSASHAGRFYGSSSKNNKASSQRKREKTLDTFEDNDDENEDFDYMEDTEESIEIKKFISLVKKLQIKDGQTPLPDSLKKKPRQPRLLASLSSEGQYALMKTYEDTIANEILKMHPNLSVYIPRVLTSKFRRRTNIPKHLKFLGNRLESLSESLSRETSLTLTKQNTFLQESNLDRAKMPKMPEDSQLTDHQILMSQQLEIAQQIMDKIKKNKGEYITSSKEDFNENLDILRAYAAYVKIWTKYFHLR